MNWRLTLEQLRARLQQWADAQLEREPPPMMGGYGGQFDQAPLGGAGGQFDQAPLGGAGGQFDQPPLGGPGGSFNRQPELEPPGPGYRPFLLPNIVEVGSSDE